MGSLSALVCGLYPYCNGHWSNQSTCILILKATKLIKAHLLPPTVWSLLLSLCPCPDLPCVLGQGFPALPGPTDTLGSCCQHRKAIADLCSVLESAFPQTWLYLGLQCQPRLESATGSESLQRAALSDTGPEQLMPKLGDPAVLELTVCVFSVTVFNFTTQSIQNSWEIPLEIQNSLGVFISSNFSEQGTKAI